MVANEDDDHQEHDNDDARGALIKEESCVKTIVIDIVLGPHGREAWGAAILLLDALAPLHRQRKGGAGSPRRNHSCAMTRLNTVVPTGTGTTRVVFGTTRVVSRTYSSSFSDLLG